MNFGESIYGPGFLVRMADLPELTGVSRSHLYRLIAQNRFPQGIPITPGSTIVVYLKSEVMDWVEARNLSVI